METLRHEKDGGHGVDDQQADQQTDLEAAWWAVVAELAPNQRAWLSTCDPVTVHDELAIIAVPDEFTRTQVEGRLRHELEGAISAVYGRKIGLGTTINPALAAGSPERATADEEYTIHAGIFDECLAFFTCHAIPNCRVKAKRLCVHVQHSLVHLPHWISRPLTTGCY